MKRFNDNISSLDLCAYAQEWAEYMAANKRLEHRRDRRYGENVFYAYNSRGFIRNGNINANTPPQASPALMRSTAGTPSAIGTIGSDRTTTSILAVWSKLKKMQ